MEIKESDPGGLPQILDGLKASLGETSSKKKEEVWQYKLDNSFGKSLVLVVVENNDLDLF